MDRITGMQALIRLVDELDLRLSCLGILLPGTSISADTLYHIDTPLHVERKQSLCPLSAFPTVWCAVFVPHTDVCDSQDQRVGS